MPRLVKPRRAFETNERYYHHDKHPLIPAELGRLVSVTSITSVYPKPWMMGWVQKEVRLKIEALMARLASGIVTSDELNDALLDIPKAAQRKRDSAASVGRIAHGLIHDFLKGKPVGMPADEKVHNIMALFEKWHKEVGFKLIDTEQVVFSAKHRYAGRLDTVGWVEGHVTLVDFKSSASIYREMSIQIAAYAEAYQESMPVLYGADDKPITRLKIIRLGKDEPEWDVQDMTAEWQDAFETFLALKRTWEFDKRK